MLDVSHLGEFDPKDVAGQDGNDNAVRARPSAMFLALTVRRCPVRLATTPEAGALSSSKIGGRTLRRRCTSIAA
jgi:hypothetical protein